MCDLEKGKEYLELFMCSLNDQLLCCCADQLKWFLIQPYFFCTFWDVTAKMKKKASVILARDATLVSSSPPALLPEKSLITPINLSWSDLMGQSFALLLSCWAEATEPRSTFCRGRGWVCCWRCYLHSVYLSKSMNACAKTKSKSTDSTHFCH